MSKCSLIARRSTITTEQILEAARSFFLEKGIQTTTAEVARRAGVAEGSVFNRFRTKQELFLSAMEPTLHDPPFLRKLSDRVGRGSVRRNLFDVASELLAFLRPIVPLMMMA